MNRLFAIGEALIDAKIDEGKERMFVGGAPLNFIYYASRLYTESYLISSIGKDFSGDHILRAFLNLSLDERYLFKSSNLPTAKALVTNDSDGERHFDFKLEDSASSRLDLVKLPHFESGDILYFGTVGLISKENQSFYEDLFKKSLEIGVTIIFDANLRYSLFDKRDLLVLTDKFLRYPSIVKLSIEELDDISGVEGETDGVFEIFKRYTNIKLLLISKGEDGADLFSPDKTIKSSSKNISAIDTTGAGDALFGTFIGYLLMEKIKLDSPIDFFVDAIKKACDVASDVCLYEGALPRIETKKMAFDFADGTRFEGKEGGKRCLGTLFYPLKRYNAKDRGGSQEEYIGKFFGFFEERSEFIPSGYGVAYFSDGDGNPSHYIEGYRKGRNLVDSTRSTAFLLNSDYSGKKLWNYSKFNEKISLYVNLYRKKKNTDILFIGSSSFEMWRAEFGLADYDAFVAHMDAVNTAIGGTITADWIGYLFDVLVKPFKTKKLLIYVGVNDINFGTDLDMVIDNYRDLLHLINRFNIADEIYCLSINPSRAFFASWDKHTTFNHRLKSLTGEYNDVKFIDSSELFFKDGKLKEELISKDGIHLSHEGYELWTVYFSKKVGIL